MSPPGFVGGKRLPTSSTTSSTTRSSRWSGASSSMPSPPTNGIADDEVGFYVLVFAVFLLSLSINFTMLAVYVRYVEGTPILWQVKRTLIPLLPSELMAGMMAVGVAFLYVKVGIAGITLFGIVLITFQYLIGALLVSRQRAEELEQRSNQLASFQVGMLSALLRTLDLRDQMTARHSAAVARYSRAIAQRAGFSRQEEELVHIAGLLHDIGKFILPDRILKANVPLTDEDWMLIKRHPQQGARVVSSLDGYGPVADIILAHHERIDGKGYPRGLKGDAIPELARIISVADTYDVMTARDSYRTPMSSQDAIAELRRVAGAQLDARFVETFIELLEGKDVSFQHGEAADFEKELALESRIAETASPTAARAASRSPACSPSSASPRRASVGCPDASCDLPGTGRGADRGATRAGARASRRGDHPDRGERRLRLRPPHLPRARAGRAGDGDRPRVRRRGDRGRRRRHPRGRRRPGARLLPRRLRELHRLPARRLPPLRARAHLRPRLDPRLAARHPGRPGARPLRRHGPAQGAGGDVGGCRALRRRRDGDRLPRGRARRDEGGRHGRGARPRAGRPLRGAGGGRRRRGPRLRGRLGRAAARPGGAVRRDPGPPHRGQPESRGPRRERRARRRRRGRGGRGTRRRSTRRSAWPATPGRSPGSASRSAARR